MGTVKAPYVVHISDSYLEHGLAPNRHLINICRLNEQCKNNVWGLELVRTTSFSLLLEGSFLDIPKTQENEKVKVILPYHVTISL